VTLVVGILSKDGVVIATDRQMSLGAMGQMTIGQAGTKTEVINGQALFAFSGAMAAGQQIGAALKALQPRFGATSTSDAVQNIQAALRPILEPTFTQASKAGAALGPQAFHEVLCTGVFAAKFRDGFRLLEIGNQGTCEILSADKVPFACLGSGKGNGDPILGSLWRIYWNNEPLSLREAILAGYWTVKVCIELKTAHVGFEPDVFVLEKTGAHGQHMKTRHISADELSQHDEFILAVENAMRDVRRQRLTEGASVAPAPPKVSG
jgi:hypothetical protein